MTFIITGGGSGIGKALAMNLADRGEQVLICGRLESNLKKVCGYAPEFIRYIVGDLTKQNTVMEITKFVKNISLKGLIQNAGQIKPISSIASMSIEDYQEQQNINVVAPIQLFQLLKEKLIGGRVLHLSSLAAHVPFESWGGYCISKSSLFMLYQILKKECSDIHFGSVMPGITDTDMQSQIRNAEQMDAKSQKFFINLYNQKALLEPAVVAQFLSWLVLDISSEEYSKAEWDIYDKSHHQRWLKNGEVISI